MARAVSGCEARAFSIFRAIDVTVELVAKEVQDQRRPRLDLLHRLGEAGLVDLEDAPVRFQLAIGPGAIQRRRSHAEDEVRPGAVGDDAVPSPLEQPAEETCGGRLAVGPGHDDRAVRQILG